MNNPTYDIAVVGGGINGAGIAAEAQSRGLKTLLIEKNDLASATSSASSKLIHGGLRYLEHYEFRLVRESLNEREFLLRTAPFLIKPMRFILPHEKHLRPAWMIRLGLFLYDHLGKRDILPGSSSVRFSADSPLKPDFTRGFEYSDCWVDDARLVALKAVQCAEAGGTVLTRTRCEQAQPVDGIWQLDLADVDSGQHQSFEARALVNAAGTFVNDFLQTTTSNVSHRDLRLVRGSHIVIPKLYEGEKAYILQNPDGRIVFVIPYLGKFSMIGTTDVEHHGSRDDVRISEEETSYLCQTVNRYFKRQISPTDIVWSFSGLRALFSEEDASPQEISRDYSLELSDSFGPPLVNVYGGKLTTFRKLSEKAVNLFTDYFPHLEQTNTSPLLPGGDLAGDIIGYQKSLSSAFPFLSDWSIQRLATSYGTRAEMFLQHATQIEDLGINFGMEFTAAEVDYLVHKEFARTAVDILWRRTKMGLFLEESQINSLSAYMKEHYPL